MNTATLYTVHNTFEIFGGSVLERFATLEEAEQAADREANLLADIFIDQNWFQAPEEGEDHWRTGCTKEGEFSRRWEGRDLRAERDRFVADIRESAVAIACVTPDDEDGD
jgi:hypothetical protein